VSRNTAGNPTPMSYDAIVIGAGHNGLVAANRLADHGWSVVVLEAQPEPGGAVRSAQTTAPGFVSDRFSSFYPFGYASPALRELELERHGLRWRRSPVAVAHPGEDGRCAFVSSELEETVENLDSFAAGDGESWRALYTQFTRLGPAIMEALVTPFPPVRAGARIIRALGSRRELLRFARFLLLPARRMGEEHFRGDGGRWLLAGNGLHGDLMPEVAGGGAFGWLLCGLGQAVGFPVPEGGSGELTRALVRRLESLGGRVECGRHVDHVSVRDGRATGVRVEGGRTLHADRAVLADTSAPALYGQLLDRDQVPDEILQDLEHLHLDNATVKVDWALDGPIPWTAPAAARAATIHLSDGVDGLTAAYAAIAQGHVPDRPFLIMGQYAASDPSRCPAGKEVAWAYTHVPYERARTPGEVEEVVRRMEAEVERFAPGFSRRVLARVTAGPDDLHAADENLERGAINLGVPQLHQLAVFRPIPGLGRPETPVRGLYLCSAAAHPSGGVHGGPGNAAARAAVAHDRFSVARRRA
jgi:phytoene dehydrogenase-like protein